MAVTELPPYDGIREGAAELALRRHGFTGERLQKLARKVANDSLRAKGATLGDRFDDLVSSLCVVGLRAALRYDPEMTQAKYGKNGGEPFSSYLADVMEHRVIDFYRAKGEGFGDRRYNNDGRLVLAGDTTEDLVDLDFDFGRLISEGRLIRWQLAAKLTEWSFEEFVVITLDRAARDLERAAA